MEHPEVCKSSDASLEEQAKMQKAIDEVINAIDKL